ncbi:MAG: glycosyltransferase family 4 protein [Patescibacteria group bacterium]
MKILLINERLDFAGGAERYTVDIAAGLAGLGHEIEIIYGFGDKFSIPESALSTPLAKVKTVFIDGLEVAAVSAEAQSFNPDVINVQSINEPKLLTELSRLKPTTSFIHDHRSYCPGNSKLWFSSNRVCPIPMSLKCAAYAYKEKCMTRRITKLVGRINNRREMLSALGQLPLVMCNSHYVREQLIQNGLDEKKVVVNGLFPGGLSTGVSGTFRPETELQPEILFVGRVFIEKGVEYLLRAAALISDIPFKISIIGEGWDLKRCGELALELKIDGRAEFTGFLPREEIDKFYQRCRLLVVPSIWPEPFGMVGLEAYRFGKPVVAFAEGGVTDWLSDNQTGYLVERGNVQMLADKMSVLLRDSSLAGRLGEAGRSLVLEKFSPERHLRQLTDTYRSLTVNRR